MKVLHLMPYSPVPPMFGGALRTYHLLNKLADRHDVTVVAYGTEQDKKNMLDTYGNRLRAVHMVPSKWSVHYRRLGQIYALCTNHSYFHFSAQHEEMQKTLNRLFDRERFDLVQTEFPMMGSFDMNTDAIKILDAHNVEYDNFRRMAANARSVIRKLHYTREYRKLYVEEIDACSRQDAMFVTSSRDKEIFDSDIPHIPKYVIPNGVDMAYFQPCDSAVEPHSMVFTGMMAYVPNYDGILYFLDKIFPGILAKIPDAKIYIVGNRPPKDLENRASANVIITGYVDDVRPFIRRANLYVVPLRMGSGTRLKVLEAMAMKKPIVTTTIGCEGIDVKNGEDVFIEDDPVSFAGRVVQLFDDPETRSRCIQRGYELVASKYDWSTVGESVENVYQELMKSKIMKQSTERLHRLISPGDDDIARRDMVRLKPDFSQGDSIN
jgi:polysaccharide biosynthesis protein PslH